VAYPDASFLSSTVALSVQLYSSPRSIATDCRLSPDTGCDDNKERMTDQGDPHSQSAEPTDSTLPAATTSLDEPMDAIVYDIHPAFVPQARVSAYPSDYPYGPNYVPLPPPNSERSGHVAHWAGKAGMWLITTADNYFAALQSPPDFVVPKTFGMSAILGIMTALAMVFACLRWLNAEPVFYFFFSVEALAICLAQMFYGKTPRLASIIAGAIILPAFTFFAALFHPNDGGLFICVAVIFIPFGAVLGYLTGTCAAGIFLVMDYLEPYLQGRVRLSLNSRGQTCSR
jgi:hypothetical protein